MRLSKNPKIINLSPNLGKLNQYLINDPRITAVYLFGSYGTKYQHALSDVDFGVLSKSILSFDEQLEIMAKFTDLLHEDDVNIIFLNNSDLIIQYQVITTGRLVFCRENVILADFIEYVNKRYCDFRIDLDIFYRDYDQGIKEEFLGG